MFKEPSFISLIQRSHLGCERSLNKLLRDLQPKIKAYCNKFFLKSKFKIIADIDEIIQRINLSIYRNITKLKDLLAFKSWFYIICRTNCIEHYRLTKKHNSNYPNIEFEVEDESENNTEPVLNKIPGDIVPPDLELERKDLYYSIAKKVKEVFSQMRLEEIHVFMNVRVNNMRYSEYAEKNQIKEGTVKSRIGRAMKNIRREFEEANIYRHDLDNLFCC